MIEQQAFFCKVKLLKAYLPVNINSLFDYISVYTLLSKSDIIIISKEYLMGVLFMKEKTLRPVSGFWVIALIAVCLGGGIYGAVQEYVAVSVILFVVAAILCTSITVVQPNKSVVVTFFGKYVGTIATSGLFAVIPFSVRKTVSLRVRNFNSVKLKVNDVEGNPIEIAAVIVFKVINSAKALFDVDKYMAFVEIQSETALRHVASKYPYDNFNESGMSLRANADEIAKELATELQ